MDPISPVAVGQYLTKRFSDADLHVFEGVKHDLGFTHAAQIILLIDQHLKNKIAI